MIYCFVVLWSNTSPLQRWGGKGGNHEEVVENRFTGDARRCRGPRLPSHVALCHVAGCTPLWGVVYDEPRETGVGGDLAGRRGPALGRSWRHGVRKERQTVRRPSRPVVNLPSVPPLFTLGPRPLAKSQKEVSSGEKTPPPMP